MSLLDQLMALPPRESKRATKEVLPWVKIVPSNNPRKPKVKLSSKTVELITSENSYILFRELEGTLYITTPSPYSADCEPNKVYDTRIGTTGLEITKAVIDTFQTDLSGFHGEYLLELVDEQELATKSGENKLIKTFKLVINGNSNESAELSTQDSSDGVSHNEGEEHGSVQDGGLSESFDLVGGSNGQDLVLLENSVF
jgi:hypothetical protein